MLREAVSWLQVGKSDPYVIAHIRDRLQSSFTTAIVKDILNPVWIAEHAFGGVTEADVSEFKVYDHDVGKKDDFFGRVDLVPHRFWPHGFEGDLALLEVGHGITAALTIEVSVLPPEVVANGTRAFVSIHNTPLFALTREGRFGLAAGTSGLFVECWVPGTPPTKFQTPVRGSANAEWNEKAEISDYKRVNDLDFALPVLHHHLFGLKDDFLGSCVLLGSLFEGGYDGDMELTGRGAVGKLKVSVEVA